MCPLRPQTRHRVAFQIAHRERFQPLDLCERLVSGNHGRVSSHL